MAAIAPYGSWESPVDAAQVLSTSVGFTEIRVDVRDLWWREIRPSEGGRQVLVHRGGNHARPGEFLSADTNVRTAVHEYGGGAYVVAYEMVVYSNFEDHRLYAFRVATIVDGIEPWPITPEPPRPSSIRYADMRLSGNTLICVRESHPKHGEAVNELIAIPLVGTHEQVTLVSGPDFVASPRVSRDGTQLAWLSWSHPNMPWDETELWVAPLDGLTIGAPAMIAGGSDVSVVQPEWGPDGALYFSSDDTGWWNLYRHDAQGTSPVFNADVEAGFPQWQFGASRYGFLAGGRIVVAYYENGAHRLGIVDPDGGLAPLNLDYSRYDSIATDGASRVFFVGHHPARQPGIHELDVDRGTEDIVAVNPDVVDPDFIPKPQPITFPTGDDEVAHGFYYPPTNPNFAGPKGERPPLRVEIHGGPTSNTFPALSLGFLFWTSRGIAVVDVNYRGSTGYGRAYRDRLKGQWGVVDVEDAVAAARYLAEQGLVDPDRLTITGGSAGGFTTLAALAFDDAFAAGSSYYGIADLRLLEEGTHKFESRYEDSLVGSREAKHVRSPINHLHGFDRPVILFQGTADRVVPPDQAEVIADALDRKGVPHALVMYEGEEHGFRRAENIVDALESELSFFGRVLGFVPAGDLATPQIKHAEALGR